MGSNPLRQSAGHQWAVDLPGAALLAIAIIALIVGLSQSQGWGWGSPAVWGLLAVAVIAGVAFVAVEQRRDQPLVDLRLLTKSPNFRTAVISQNLAGAAELGLGVILPLLLILNLGMSPGVAGLALLPASVPLILIAPLVGRWYDKAGTRPPMLTEYLCVSRHLVSCWLSAASHSTTGSSVRGWACRRPYRQRPGQRH